jgi:hypothetical protein
MDITDIINQAEARLRADGQFPPVNGEGYDLNDPQLRKELLGMEIVNFKLNPLPPEIQKFLDGLNRPMTPSEEDVICDYLDRVFNLAPNFVTCPGEHNSIWVVETKDFAREKQCDPAFRERMKQFDPATMTLYDLQQYKDMMRRLGPHLDDAADGGEKEK